MSAGIYSITHVPSGKQYIGSSVNIKYRITTHKRNLHKNQHPNHKLQSAWNKYGGADFEFKALLYCDKEQLFYFEQLCIGGFTPEYNLAVCADHPTRGTTISDELKALWSSQRKGRRLSEETKQKISKVNMGHVVTEETRAKIRVGHIGKKLTAEHIEKMRISKIGKTNSDEAKRKIGEATRLRYQKLREEYNQLSEETKQQLELEKKKRRREAKLRYKKTNKGKEKNREYYQRKKARLVNRDGHMRTESHKEIPSSYYIDTNVTAVASPDK
jgi:hypothetical protein